MSTPRWPKVNPKQSFPEQELDVLKYWTEEKIFEESVAREPKNGEFVFYDGPPFATGLPHYGHILQSVIKDLVPRYQTMRGHRVARKWGWDCHGLPVENLIEKELNLADKKALEAYGIDRFNEACRASVLRYADEWRRFIPRMGRWVDMENDYKTMDPAYMESVWWVFKNLWDKELIYEGLKPMHICPRCVTPLSNFEVGLGYKDATDLSAVVKFKARHVLTGIAAVAIVVNEKGELLIGERCDPRAEGLGRWNFPAGYTDDGENPAATAVREVMEETGLIVEVTERLASAYRINGEVVHCFASRVSGGTLTESIEGRKWQWISPEEFMEREEKITEASHLAFTAWRANDTSDALWQAEPQPTYFLAWTTTPWTLPGNFALAVNPEVEYVKVKSRHKAETTFFEGRSGETEAYGEQKFLQGETFWLAKERLASVFGSDALPPEEDIEILETKKGSDLVSLAYEPLFPFFTSEKDAHPNAFTVRAADFVTTTDGTGIVHIAPAYGEDDLNLGKRDDLPLIQHVTMDGHFVPEIANSGLPFAKLPIKHGKTLNEPDKVDVEIVKWLDETGKLFDSKRERHSYPHCWRCDTALLNYATSSWFVAVEKIKEDLIKNNELVNWVPGHVKAGRFGKWIEGARDWAISRNRYWGAPLPVWKCDSCEEAVCIGSIDELTTLSGQTVTDLHKHFVDPIEWKCATCAGTMHRIPEVLDCWFESGSMPYAQTALKGDTKLPANFIAEAQDQTRGWFYTLHVLATALQDKPAFENVICSGLVLAEDGQKMSKSKKNYPDPSEIIDEFGADAMRLYLMSSPIVQGEELRFSRRGVEETLRGVLLPLWNTYYFFTTYAIADGWEGGELPTDMTNKLDRWILSELNILIREMTARLDEYKLNEAVKPLAAFLDGLTNWYVRRSRRRFWKSDSDTDKQQAYATLLHVLTTVAKLLAPVSPFIAETVYRGLTGERSVHLADWPTVDMNRMDEELSREVDITRKIISLGLAIRGRENAKVRQPLSRATIALPALIKADALGKQMETIREELNVKELVFTDDPTAIAETVVAVNARACGPRLGKKVQQIIAAAKAGNFEIKDDGVHIDGEVLTGDEVAVGYHGKAGLAVESSDGIVVALDTTITPELEREGRARDLIRVVQELRKKADFDVSDRIELSVRGADDILADESLKTYVTAETLATIVTAIATPDASDEVDGIHIAVRKI